ncbi:MAG: helix-turn-helix transcriptional regulator, partial [Thermomicrobiales bacterium]|nr:helix-turn-helix transcriptional regulator [Thermomicrobiales bacterium]
SQWINDRRTPTPESLDRIADALAVDLHEVYRHAGLYAPVKDAPEVQAVLGALRRVRLTPERVRTLRAVLESWASYDRTSPAKDAASES